MKRNVAHRQKGFNDTFKSYLLSPKAFEKCLMRSKNSDKYADYYILLRECVYGFNDYIKELKIKKEKEKHDKIMNQKDDKIDDMKKTIDEMKQQNDELLINSRSLIATVNHLNTKLDKVIQHMIVIEDDDKKTGALIILKIQNSEYNYYIMKGQKKYILNKMKNLKKNNANVEDVLHIEYEPNPTTLWNSIKKNSSIKTKCNNFNLINTTEKQFIESIKDISNNRSK